MMATAESQPKEPAHYAELINQVSKASAADRPKLEKQILDGGAVALKQLADIVIEDVRKSRRARTWWIAGRVIALVLFAIAILAMLRWDASLAASNFWWLLFIGGGGAVATSGLHSKSTSLLSSFDDPRAVGALAQLLESPDEEVRSQAIAGLTKLLPRLTASDSELLSPEHRSRLNSYLAPRHMIRNHDFALTILKAWIHVGDESAIPAVRALDSTPWDWPFRKVKVTATECLSVLEHRAEEHRLATTLLRAATSPNSQDLLRPAQSTPETEPQLLLRPADPIN